MADDVGPHLSIAEVLGVLLDEFPDVTIAKIRVFESQKLIEPERTPSGYRKFSRADVERLRELLRQQSSAVRRLSVMPPLDDSSGAWIPDDESNTGGHVHPSEDESQPGGMSQPRTSHPSSRHARTQTPPPLPSERKPLSPEPSADMVEMAVTAGLIRGKKHRGNGPLTPLERTLVDLVARYAALGVDIRHLRLLKQSTEREALLYEQRVAPFLRQKNPVARHEAATVLHDLVLLGLELRNVLMDDAVARLTDGS